MCLSDSVMHILFFYQRPWLALAVVSYYPRWYLSLPFELIVDIQGTFDQYLPLTRNLVIPPNYFVNLFPENRGPVVFRKLDSVSNRENDLLSNAVK